MADIKKLSPIILKWEGGFVNDPVDRGGATNKGVTIATWRKVGYDKDGDGDIDVDDMKLLTQADFEHVLRIYWNRWQADKIKSQALANILVDWVWGSGAWGIKIPQRILGLMDDGKVGRNTLSAINAADPKSLFAKIYVARLKFLENIVTKDPKQKRFLKGWKNRLADFKYFD